MAAAQWTAVLDAGAVPCTPEPHTLTTVPDASRRVDVACVTLVCPMYIPDRIPFSGHQNQVKIVRPIVEILRN